MIFLEGQGWIFLKIISQWPLDLWEGTFYQYLFKKYKTWQRELFLTYFFKDHTKKRIFFLQRLYFVTIISPRTNKIIKVDLYETKRIFFKYIFWGFIRNLPVIYLRFILQWLWIHTVNIYSKSITEIYVDFYGYFSRTNILRF